MTGAACLHRGLRTRRLSLVGSPSVVPVLFGYGVGLAVMAALGMTMAAGAQVAPKEYRRMAPLGAYLMQRNAEIALARTAAPASISGKAGVMVLGRHGYVTAIQGTNGFVCVVGRGWTSAADSDFWNPKVRVPMCLNAAGARTYLRRIEKWTEMVLAGRTRAEMNKMEAAAVASGALPAMAPGAMCYMTGHQGYGGDAAPHWPAHLMLFFSGVPVGSWGANQPGSPITGLADPVEQITTFVLRVAHWSDGTEASHGGN